MSLPPSLTPSRPGPSDRLPFPYTGTPPSQRTTPSASTNSTPSASNVKPTTAPISLSSLLAAHASAPHPHAAALDQALSERNQLSSQNSQLWKLIEKQRSGYNQMLKELERVRAERDSLRSRVGGPSKAREKTLKGSVSNSAMSGSSSSVASTAASSGTTETRPPPARHHSDNIGKSTLSMIVECFFFLALLFFLFFVFYSSNAYYSTGRTFQPSTGPTPLTPFTPNPRITKCAQRCSTRNHSTLTLRVGSQHIAHIYRHATSISQQQQQ